MKFVLTTLVTLSACAAFAGQEQYPTPLPSGQYGSTHTGANSGAPSWPADTGSEAYPTPLPQGNFPTYHPTQGAPDVGSEQYPTYNHR